MQSKLYHFCPHNQHGSAICPKHFDVNGGSLLRTQIVDLVGKNDLEDSSSDTQVGLDGIIEESETVIGNDCGRSSEDLSDRELADCLATFSEELVNRNK